VRERENEKEREREREGEKERAKKNAHDIRARMPLLAALGICMCVYICVQYVFSLSPSLRWNRCSTPSRSSLIPLLPALLRSGGYSSCTFSPFHPIYLSISVSPLTHIGRATVYMPPEEERASSRTDMRPSTARR